jgi:nitroreductase
LELEQAIRGRRTHKAFDSTPVEPAVLEELFELARWAPNHHLSNPWRFRVLGEMTRERLKLLADASSPGSGAKLDRAPTLIVVSVCLSADAVADQEDVLAGGVAAYIVLLAAHGRGLAGYWRTLGLLEDPPARALLGIEHNERVLGLLHLGGPRQSQRVPQRAPLREIVTYLQ